MKNRFLVYLLFLSSLAYGQMDEYDYSRELIDVEDQWHRLTLPNDLFEKVSDNYADLRIFGVNVHNDTIEAPYILEQAKEKIVEKSIDFKIINTTYDPSGHYFTLALDKATDINQIRLNFRETNFDWKLQLAGSQDQQKWFTLLQDYRILSIENNSTKYKFTTVNFPTANYQFFRLHVNSQERVDLVTANIFRNERSEGNYQSFTPHSIETKENKAAKQTEVVVDLGITAPISQLKFELGNTFDFYRPISIQYVTDSFEVKGEWRYNYRQLTSATLSSVEENIFKFNTTILRRLKIIIQNHDNEALSLNSVLAKGPVHQMLIRFTQEGKYFLAYGNPKANKPNYDIDYFTNNIPENSALIHLDKEQKREKPVETPKDPLFENKAWLWAVMGIIIVLLTWFSLKMMKEN